MINLRVNLEINFFSWIVLICSQIKDHFMKKSIEKLVTLLSKGNNSCHFILHAYWIVERLNCLSRILVEGFITLMLIHMYWAGTLVVDKSNSKSAKYHGRTYTSVSKVCECISFLFPLFWNNSSPSNCIIKAELPVVHFYRLSLAFY